MKRAKLGFAAAMAAALVLGNGLGLTTALAHSPPDPSAVGSISKMVASANLVIRGKVKSVTYRTSEAGTSGAIPFTFVTYRVSETLLGTARSEVTLRFPGGATGTGGFVSVEGVPTFAVGDEDILFVSGSGAEGCALVQCEFGRYRVYNGAVYEAHGSPVLSIASGRLVSGGPPLAELQTIRYAAPRFDDVIKNPGAVQAIKKLGMSMEQARARYDAEAPKMIVAGAAHSGRSAGAARTTGLLVGTVTAAIRQGVSAAPRRAVAAVADADPSQRIPALQLKAEQPPQ